jgi:homoaconitase/3-isopropylmalate dehydratase large subunit
VDRALEHWRTLSTDDGAEFDREVEIDCGALEPQITWGTDRARCSAFPAACPIHPPPTVAAVPRWRARSPTWT